MDIQIANTTFIITYLASVIIPFPCLSGLRSPIRPIIIRIKSAFPIRVILASHFIGSIFAFASLAAKATVFMICEKSRSFIRLITNCANKPYTIPYFEFGLPGGKFAHALMRAKARLAISPCYEFFIAKITSKLTFRIGLMITICAFLRTVLSIILGSGKFFVTKLANKMMDFLTRHSTHSSYVIPEKRRRGGIVLEFNACQRVINSLKPIDIIA